MSKKELEKEKAALVKWLNGLEDETVIRYLSEVRKKKRSFDELRSLINKKAKAAPEKKEEKPTAQKGGKMSRAEFRKFLLSAPVMTDEELEYIQDKRKLLNEWK